MNNSEHAFLINNSYIDDELIGMVGCADLGIASGIYQRTKLEGLANLCGLTDCYINYDMEYASFEEVWPRIENVVKHRCMIADKLKERIPLLKNDSRKVVQTVAEYLLQSQLQREPT